MDEPLGNIRNHLIRLLEKGRFTLPTQRFSEMPYVWQPEQVINPADGQPFTRKGACHFIKEQLEKRCSIKTVVLDIPCGKTAYEMVFDIGENVPDLYVKVQLGSGYVIGRSFHYSTRPKRKPR